MAQQSVRPLVPCASPTMADTDSSADGDLGFSCCTRKIGDVEVLHQGRVAATLRGNDVRKRGNERLATGHPRKR
jgi:hypothetical protein